MHSHTELVSESKIKSHTKRFFASAQNDGDNQTYRHTEALAEVSNKQNSNNGFFGRITVLALNGTPLRSCPLLVQRSQKAAFTLAEVLITLGIIGIVAAITIPTIHHKIQRKVLKVSFTKMDAVLQQAMKRTSDEFSVDSFKDFNARNVIPKEENKEYFSDVDLVWGSQFTGATTLTPQYLWKTKKKVTNFKGTKNVLDYGSVYGMEFVTVNNPYMYLLQSGASVTSLTYFYHGAGDGITFTFDTNGPYNGPNRYGYDLFIYTTGTWHKVCNRIDTTHYNGRGCYDWAKKDKNPDDPTKGYWDSLYR